MKILVAGSVQGDGGYEEEGLCRLLEAELRAMGHTVDCFMLPYERNILSLPEQMTAYSLLRIDNCDRLITVGYPACMLNHPHKVCYLLQMEPMLAEYWDSPYGVLANRQYSDILETVMHMNGQALHAAEKVYASSELLCDDIRKFYGLGCTPMLYPALEYEGNAPSGGEAGFILCETALLPWQRPELILEAASDDRKANIRVFVPNANEIYLDDFQELIHKSDLEGRVRLVQGRAGTAEIRASLGIFLPDYQLRRVPNIAACAVRLGKRAAVMADGGAPLPLFPESSRIKRLSRLSGALARGAAPSCTLPSREVFAKELLAG